MSTIDPPEELLSAYLDGEVDRGGARARRSAGSRSRRSGARCSRRCARPRELLQAAADARTRPTGFWDAMLAVGRSGAGRTAPRGADRVGASPTRQEDGRLAAPVPRPRPRSWPSCSCRASRGSSRRSPPSSTSHAVRSSVTRGAGLAARPGREAGAAAMRRRVVTRDRRCARGRAASLFVAARWRARRRRLGRGPPARCEHSRDAATDHDFTGTVEVEWRDGRRQRQRDGRGRRWSDGVLRLGKDRLRRAPGTAGC